MNKELADALRHVESYHLPATPKPVVYVPKNPLSFVAMEAALVLPPGRVVEDVRVVAVFAETLELSALAPPFDAIRRRVIEAATRLRAKVEAAGPPVYVRRSLGDQPGGLAMWHQVHGRGRAVEVLAEYQSAGFSLRVRLASPAAEEWLAWWKTHGTRLDA